MRLEFLFVGIFPALPGTVPFAKRERFFALYHRLTFYQVRLIWGGAETTHFIEKPAPPPVAGFLYNCYNKTATSPVFIMKLNGNGKAGILSFEDKEKIHEHLPEKYQVLFDIMWYSGARLSEALQIRFCDIAENTIIFRKSTTKGQKDTREIRVPEKLIKRIMRLENKGAYIFIARSGQGYLSRATADVALRNALKKAGFIGYSSHSYRRSIISNLSANKVPIKVIMKISGHRSLQSVAHYIDIDEGQVLSALQSRW